MSGGAKVVMRAFLGRALVDEPEDEWLLESVRLILMLQFGDGGGLMSGPVIIAFGSRRVVRPPPGR